MPSERSKKRLWRPKEQNHHADGMSASARAVVSLCGAGQYPSSPHLQDRGDTCAPTHRGSAPIPTVCDWPQSTSASRRSSRATSRARHRHDCALPRSPKPCKAHVHCCCCCCFVVTCARMARHGLRFAIAPDFQALKHDHHDDSCISVTATTFLHLRKVLYGLSRALRENPNKARTTYLGQSGLDISCVRYDTLQLPRSPNASQSMTVRKRVKSVTVEWKR
ncbi:hypothetical protein JKP88DRAFT_253777 [Tribonema minus]|uniref:Uncharacterized protein n=1 Tax=Tribonema minus TaxID=303371 RepID=A0A835ZF86_9STRA|nr:hypothetical protein JKP88DRAFT_253777 [Tribonema minus]